jgi:peptidyl-prolyl cis-trans isomerase B (cyclophilin B)
VIALAKILRGNPERFFQVVGSSPFARRDASPAWASAMAELGGPDAVEELNRILVQTLEKSSASETETLAAVLNALAKTQAPELQEILAALLGSQDAALLRAAAAVYQPRIGAKAPWAPIIQAFTASVASSDIQARVEILSRLKPWVGEAKVQQMLRSGLQDPERNVQLACAALLRRAGVTDIAKDLGPSNRSLTDAFCRALGASRNNSTIARLETNRGTMEIELFREDAPVTVANFVLMATSGAYDGLEFEQVVPLHRIEGRSPGTRAALGRAIPGEINMRPFERGSVGMALAGRSSETGRFFITLAPQPYLDGINTCFGRVISGMQVADRIVPRDRIERVGIKETISLLDHYRY